MREILFRGMRKDNDQWAQGSLFTEGSRFEIVRGTCNKVGIEGVDVIPETVGQYTGLTDKNGTKIFEGDIVWGDDCSGTWHKGIVEYDDNLGCFIVNAQNFMQYPKNEDCYCLSGHWCVEGNIHDNEELLKEGAK